MVISIFHNQVFQTVIVGTLVFVIGQIVQNFILKPMFEYKKTIGRIDNRLKFYANIIGSQGDKNIPRNEKLECARVVRNLSCELEANFKQLPFHWYFSKDYPKQVSGAARRLIRLSNLVFGPPGSASSEIVYKDEQTIRENLKIPSLD
ncbi:MAG: hypothetical protein ABSE91_03000 [Patescibacteria group bacterium]|jgi:hypothetical protein